MTERHWYAIAMVLTFGAAHEYILQGNAFVGAIGWSLAIVAFGLLER